MLNKKTVRDVAVNSKKVLLRCDFNVPLSKEDSSKITSTKRIVESLKTINYLVSAGAKVIICSHIGKTGQNLSLAPVAKELSELLDKNVPLLADIMSSETEDTINNMQISDVVLLENTRMYKEEEENDPKFAEKLASFADIYVNDAFGSAHRAHASTEGVTKYLPSVCGFLIEKELNALDRGFEDPKRPFVAVIGGIKVSSKIGVLEVLIDKVDTILIGGAMANTFLKSKGYNMQESFLEEDKLEIAHSILKKAEEKEVALLLPTDLVVNRKIGDTYSDTKIVNIENVEEGYKAFDIGPETIKNYSKYIKGASTVFWNGPLGMFEEKEFENGTKQIAEAMANTDAVTIIGGGDSAAAIEKYGLEKEVSHLSTGGGASLELIEGKKLPGIEALNDK